MNELVYAIVIGIAVGSFIYIPLTKLGITSNLSGRVVAIGSYTLGFGVTWWLFNNSGYLNQAMESIVGKAIAVIFALLRLAAAFYNKQQ